MAHLIYVIHDSPASACENYSRQIDVWHLMATAVYSQSHGRVTWKIDADILPPRLDDGNFSYTTRNDQRWH